MNTKLRGSIAKLASKPGPIHQVVVREFSQKKEEPPRPRLRINENGSRQSISGIRATIFGATGFMGPYVGATLGYISSDVIFPHNHKYFFDDEVKELKLCASTGYSYIVRNMNFDDTKMIDRVIANSNVVINLIGARRNIKLREDYERANITLAKRIAQACRKNPGVLRLIHFSAAGASKDSPSLDLQTKFYGEEAVLSEFPNATIFRPTTIFGMNDYFVQRIMTERNFLYHYNLCTTDLTAKRQPIFCHDVAMAVLNALKLDESAGQIYELGGPNVYTLKEVYEVIYNILGREPKLVHVNPEFAKKFAQWFFKNWEFLNLDYMIKEGLDIVVSKNAKTIQDLYVQPTSFPQAVEPQLNDLKARHGHFKDEFER